MTKERTYNCDPKFVSHLNEQCRCKCPRCRHTMIIAVRYKWVTCDHCWKKYENNSKGYKIKKIKEMIKKNC